MTVYCQTFRPTRDPRPLAERDASWDQVVLAWDMERKFAAAIARAMNPDYARQLEQEANSSVASMEDFNPEEELVF